MPDLRQSLALGLGSGTSDGLSSYRARLGQCSGMTPGAQTRSRRWLVFVNPDEAVVAGQSRRAITSDTRPRTGPTATGI
jgi:hypothetical protein